ncbi:MAG: succinate dehydrogenase, hydrophobic membrane anchor protein [Pseudomonadales bacterium]|nr:succinate dehydrogenase, hydrophobic membrane anchor protein [Pseudomonadales bacterium]
MVTNVTSFGRSGLSDFVLQRVSAVILAAYTLCIMGFFLTHESMTHQILVGYFTTLPMQIFSTMAMVSLIAHAWIGMWTIGTDYIREHYFGTRALASRLFYQSACIAALFIYALWAMNLIWRL